MFDGAKCFGVVAFFAIGGGLIAWNTVGCWGLAGVALGLYFLLPFFNALERRDIRDHDAANKPPRKRRK